MDLTSFCNFPELKPGIAIYFIDVTGKTRTEFIFDRTGDEIIVKNANKKITTLSIDKVIGYWQPNVKITRQNMIPIKKENKK